MIQVVDVYRSFGRQQVLKGINFQVERGEILAIIGRSGSGKTVMLRLLIGLIRSDRGQIIVEGTDITTLYGRRLDRVRERFGMLFQGGALFDSMNVLDNVAFPLREKTDFDAAKIAETVRHKLALVHLKEVEKK